MELFGMIMVLLVIVLLASDYSRRKKGLDYDVPEKELPKYEDDSFTRYRYDRCNRLDDPSWW